jgi:hypothetical protein
VRQTGCVFPVGSTRVGRKRICAFFKADDGQIVPKKKRATIRDTELGRMIEAL